jgi:hypothetical protein
MTECKGQSVADTIGRGPKENLLIASASKPRMDDLYQPTGKIARSNTLLLLLLVRVSLSSGGLRFVQRTTWPSGR